MPVKSPPRGNSSGNPPVRQNAVPDVDTPRLDLPLRTASDISIPGGQSSRPGRLPTPADIDAIEPAPGVTVHQPGSPIDNAHGASQSLEHYWVPAASGLSDRNADGLRTHKGRQYVDVPGGIVLVGKDPETGLYRARRPSESSPRARCCCATPVQVSGMSWNNSNRSVSRCRPPAWRHSVHRWTSAACKAATMVCTGSTANCMR